MKPIEPGCLALTAPGPKYVIRRGAKTPAGQHPAHVVNVVRKETHLWIWPCDHCGSKSDRWRIVSPLWDVQNQFSCACRLTRIDGYDPDTEITEKDKELTV